MCIGLLSFAFHRVFVVATNTAYDSLIPGIDSAAAVGLLKWTLGGALILPQSVLLGMTFPLLVSGLLRLEKMQQGKTIAVLYFANSAGAAVGVLASGFFLISRLGLPGTLVVAGFLNVGVAVAMYLAVRNVQPAIAISKLITDSSSRTQANLPLMMGVASATGLASFMYEIGWIRMLNMVLGSSTHSFELMLSAFIFGLAFGGFWISRKIQRLTQMEVFLGFIQVAMGLFALASLVVYGATFEAMSFLIAALAPNEAGYTLYNVGSHFIAWSVMLPAAFCAGTTLPLITNILIRAGAGEKAVGIVYSSNTLGSILGVFVMLFIAMPYVGLKTAIVIAATIDIAVGLWLLKVFMKPEKRRAFAVALMSSCVAIVAVATFAKLDPEKMASGVFRTGKLIPPGYGASIPYHRDGRTATVHLMQVGNVP
jgi:predicted membrane-bound spermidine synthase